MAETAIKDSVGGGIRMALMFAAILALLGVVVSAQTIAPSKRSAQKS